MSFVVFLIYLLLLCSCYCFSFSEEVIINIGLFGGLILIIILFIDYNIYTKTGTNFIEFLWENSIFDAFIHRRENPWYVEMSFKDFQVFYESTLEEDSEGKLKNPYIRIFTLTKKKDILWYPKFQKSPSSGFTQIIFSSFLDYIRYYFWVIKTYKYLTQTNSFNKEAYAEMIAILHKTQKKHKAQALQYFNAAKEQLNKKLGC